jgi:hypothetical protein
LKPLVIPLILWHDISVDYITSLAPYRRKNQAFQYLVVVIDHLIKMHHFIVTQGLGVEELAERFIERVYSLYGLLATSLSARST